MNRPALQTIHPAAPAQVISIDTARTRGSNTAASGYWAMRAALVAQRLEALELPVPAALARTHADEIAERPSEGERRARCVRDLEQLATSAEARQRAETPITRRIRRQRAAFRFVGGSAWLFAMMLVAGCIAAKLVALS